ncbi:hypothetical protein D7V71_27800 [Bacillus thuringiensis]|nr:hypothetical protein D7V71_27800 [Bacillus thuringiensis]
MITEIDKSRVLTKGYVVSIIYGKIYPFVYFAFLSLIVMWYNPIAIKLSLCKVNFRRDCFFFLKGKCRRLKDLHTK